MARGLWDRSVVSQQEFRAAFRFQTKFALAVCHSDAQFLHAGAAWPLQGAGSGVFLLSCFGGLCCSQLVMTVRVPAQQTRRIPFWRPVRADDAWNLNTASKKGPEAF